jgi:hypothetical protein
VLIGSKRRPELTFDQLFIASNEKTLALRQEVKTFKYKVTAAQFALNTKKEDLTQHLASHTKLFESVSIEVHMTAKSQQKTISEQEKHKPVLSLISIRMSNKTGRLRVCLS